MARRHVAAALADNDYGNRRLVVVAAFDVVGFSTVVEANEDAALAAWRLLRREIDPLIARGGGRIFKSLGDGLLVEFTSPVEATRSALEVQAAVAAMAPAGDIRLELRCAIHMGDVIVEGSDLLGDGINIVSRLQDHAPVGGVLVSAAVMDLISGRIDAPIKDMGSLKLKNISRPVHAYGVGAGKRPKSTPAIDSFQRRRPSIAVLPFTDQSGETANSYFSDGLVEDIISALSCLPELIVISRTSVLRYRGTAHDPRQVHRDLGVRYMLSGSVRRAGTKVRLSAELADCENGATIWSDRFAGEAADLFDLQDELSAKVVATITPQVQEAELRRVLRKRPESLDAYEYVLRGLDLFYRFEDDKFAQALPMFEKAMALDPSYATAHALAAGWYSVRINQGLSPDPVADNKEAERLSRLALTLDRFDPHALSICGHVRAFLFRDYDQAIELFDRALAANPSSAIAWLRSSATFSYIGETREARRRAEIGLRLSPYDAHVFYSYSIIALACYAAGDYADAAQWARRSAALNPRFTANLRFLAASLAANGQIDEAMQVGRDLLRVDPKFSASRFAQAYAFRDPAKRQLFADHLILAGLPK
ncbi:MAG: adenylate/guanylate cyclase domain-containing protein [Reyranella sp.]|uniref:adenylate/guanylate cyclase domain-containing protein n=1 Tax=Reyranella sp. TaxID=1929291 RepID=UPI001222FB04|nr:tetratricopeptide repeat protein [Reyranella sp.]TAJ35659.1 MAG: adenylate/guanylate cyclase domain-containing protein [Reyranella sp.]